MQWIKVEDRLPENGTNVLCIDKTGRMFVSEFVKMEVTYDPGFIYIWNHGFCCGGEPDKTTFWMPLPEPPKD